MPITNTPPGTAENRGCDSEDLWDKDTGAPQGADTVEAILGADIAGFQCEVCDEIGQACLGKECIAIYKAFLAGEEARYLEIRDAGIMGVGVYAKQNIKKGTILCEYTGRLCPIDPVVFPADCSYTWHLSGTCRVDSVVYGNISRFVNHHCTQYNCDSVDLMYGRRKVLVYRAKRAISEGEQLHVNYGVEYFDTSKPCLCTAVEYPHLLASSGRIKPAPGYKKIYPDARSSTQANKKKSRSRSSSPKTKLVSKLTRPAGVVARSKL